MFGTEDEYERAVRNSTLHANEQREKGGQSILTGLLLFVALSSISYAGYTYYKATLIKSEILTTKSEVVIEKKAVLGISKSQEPMKHEDDYMMALNEMEVDRLDETSGEPIEQFNLSQAMSEVVEDAMNSADSDYIEGLKQEIKVN
jgi:hypothetical protein